MLVFLAIATGRDGVLLLVGERFVRLVQILVARVERTRIGVVVVVVVYIIVGHTRYYCVARRIEVVVVQIRIDAFQNDDENHKNKTK